MTVDRASRLLQAVLDEPDALAARRRLDGLTAALDSTSIAGVNNVGLFASHELRVGVPQRPDWEAACATSTPWLTARGGSLIERLGFRTSRAGAHALVLSGGGARPEAVAVLLQEDEAFEASSHRFVVSPVAYGLKMAEQQGVAWLLMVRKGSIRLYPARIDLGVGRKGLAETYLELDLDSLDTDSAGYLSLLFAADALADGGTTYEILESSAQYAAALGDRLRDKVYEDIVPELSVAVAKGLERLGHEMDAAGLDLAYQLTLRVFFRMLFQVYAEDRRLLPYRQNDQYTRNAIKTLAADLLADPDREFDLESTTLWDDLTQVWRVIDTGNTRWGVPPYNGGLFSADPELHPEGALIDQIRIPDVVMGPVLQALLLDDTEDGDVGAIDFRSLSVREFGTIYEGLLESSLGLAEIDLTLDNNGTWIPAAEGDEVFAAAGEVYFHNTSGQRKGTGSYFTPSFVVEHLLERSLDPALNAHLARVADMLAAGDEAGAADAFFDFKVADLAMGSGHFLTAAIDHIEAGMASFLADDGHHIPGVAKELALLAAAARKALGGSAEEPDPSSLLRRQIARRCIYGLDINPISVELARVSIWIHTFVRGLPMSSLDHNLVCANSLTGIGNIDEALDVLSPRRRGDPNHNRLFAEPILDALEGAREVLAVAGQAAEADRDESRAAAQAYRKARDRVTTARLLFDAAVLRRIGRSDLVAAEAWEAIAAMAGGEHAQAVVRPLQPAHMPALFPEVFLRNNGGFDVLVGNPPWEKLHVEEHQWWGLRFPGLRSMPMAARTRQVAELRAGRPDLEAEYQADIETSNAARQVLAAGPYPGIGSGHIDLYKAFAWRNWHLLREGGALGLVLPRGALSGSGTQQWRRTVLAEGAFADVVVTVNTGKWVFESIHGQYVTAFVVVRRGIGVGTVRFAGPFHSATEFEAGRTQLAAVPAEEFAAWTATAAFPLIPDRTSGEIFRQMQKSPNFRAAASFDFRPVQGDMNAAQDRGQFDTDLEQPASSVPVLTGSSFNLWRPDYGTPYAYAKSTAIPHVLDKVLRSAGQARSAFNGLSIATADDLPLAQARIAFRDVTNATNTRTMICCLLPPGALLVHKAPYLVRRAGDEQDEAFLLGVMSSIPFDWYSRRMVELAMTFEILNSIPVPRPASDDPRRGRVVEVAGRLAAVDDRFSAWAHAVGAPVGSVETDDERAGLEAELDALVAHLYGLSRAQLQHVFATFHRGWNYQERLSAVLEHFDKIEVAS
jgi:hypothetical protein